MPEVRDETGKVVANQPYDAAGEEAAKKMVAENAGYSITDARNRSGVNHAGDGSVGFNSIGVPMYQEGGETKEDIGLFGVKEGVFSEAGKKRRAERKKKRQELRAARKAARQAKRSKKVVEGKNIIGASKEKHVYKEGEYSDKDNKYDVTYTHTGTPSKQQVKVVTDKGAKALSEKTEGGDYKVYGKESQKAKSYREAFANAMKKGEGTKFTWDGQEHVAKYAEKK